MTISEGWEDADDPEEPEEPIAPKRRLFPAPVKSLRLLAALTTNFVRYDMECAEHLHYAASYLDEMATAAEGGGDWDRAYAKYGLRERALVNLSAHLREVCK